MTEEKNEFEVGFGKPPKQSRFKKGQSGNPNGRPKSRKNLITDVIEEMSKSLSIREAGKEKRVTKQRAIVKAMVSASLKGDVRATGQLIGLLAQAFDVEPARPDVGKQVSKSDRMIFDRFVQREIDRQTKIRTS